MADYVPLLVFLPTSLLLRGQKIYIYIYLFNYFFPLEKKVIPFLEDFIDRLIFHFDASHPCVCIYIYIKNLLVNYKLFLILKT